MPLTLAGEWNGKPFIFCDTAGIRHRSKHDASVEVFSVMRSEQAIKRADLCVLVLDATAGISSQDKKIAGLIQKSGKACIIALNKWDLVPILRRGLESELCANTWRASAENCSSWTTPRWSPCRRRREAR